MESMLREFADHVGWTYGEDIRSLRATYVEDGVTSKLTLARERGALRIYAPAAVQPSVTCFLDGETFSAHDNDGAALPAPVADRLLFDMLVLGNTFTADLGRGRRALRRGTSTGAVASFDLRRYHGWTFRAHLDTARSSLLAISMENDASVAASMVPTGVTMMGSGLRYYGFWRRDGQTTVSLESLMVNCSVAPGELTAANG